MSFRMSSIQFMTNYQSSLNKTYQKQAKYLEQGDGSSIHRGSDDPVGYSKLLRYKINANENEQYNRNVQTAQSWMKTTDSALTHMVELTKTFKEKTIEAATDANGTSDFEAISKEMWAIIEEMCSSAKTQHGDRYVFAGQQDKTEPISLSYDVYDRAITKTLDTSQAAFFKGVSNSGGGEVYQLLKLAELDDNKNETGNIFYLDTQSGNVYESALVDKVYKEFVNKGLNTIDEVLASGTYAVSDAGLDDTEANGYVEDLLSSATTADDVTNILTEFINRRHNTSDGILTMTALGDIARDTASGTRISDILTNLGIDSSDTEEAFATALTEGKCEDYPAYPTGAFFTSQGMLIDPDSTVSVSWGTGTKTFKYVTEPQQMVTYSGDCNYISMVKINGATDVASDIVNVTGQDIFGSDIFDNEYSGYSDASGSAMINNMIMVYNKVKAGDVEWLSGDGVALADAANATVVNSQTIVGARLQLYTSVEEMLGNQSVNITEEITNVSGTDVAKLATNLMEMTTLYNMALALGGRVLPQSLADYL
ncbi:MAG: flagellar hook-associated protein 3 [Selenomonadaceae bacterium]|nr:flagellar hook-associated protein 3 [Selenomonadaceae bacterium]